ncbi:MAG TPA: hypothetical protein VHV51_10480, partial [Polyangiaceae bacterium]|nr:hypothetical protein [Polyangiaceae bacterium]
DGIDLVDDGSNEHVIEPKPSASAPNEATAPPKRARKMQPHSARSSQLYLAPSLAALAAWGLIAKPSFGAELGLGVGSAHFYGLGELELWPSQIAVRVAGVSASLEALVGAVGGCARQPLGAWSLAGCARLELGAIHGDSSGAYRDGAATAPYYALGPVLVLSVPLFGAVHARLESSLDVALDPPRFALRSFGEIDAVSRFSPSVSLGLELEPARR